MRPASGTSLFIVFLLTRAVHELGHALVLTRHGGRCPDTGIIFMLGTPCVYCDVTESWRLPGPWQRAAVAAGGMFAELIVATLAAIVWLATDPGVVNVLALQTMVVCSISTLLINANPLMRFDGYYILSDALDEPNLRSRADQCLMALTRRGLLGKTAAREGEHVSQSWRSWAFAAYSLASLIYRLGLSLMMATVMVALYTAWHFAWIGRLLAVVLLFSWWVVPAVKLSQSLLRSAVGGWARLRLAALAAWLVLMICAVPLPCREYARGWSQPERTQGLYAPDSARLERVLKRPGDSVQPGEIIFELDADQPRLQAIEAARTAEKARVQVISFRRERYFAEPNTIDVPGLETAAAAAERQAKHARAAVERLSVRATLAGQLISLPAAQLLDIDNRPVGREPALWLSADQVGRYVPTGTMLAAVCSPQQIAVLPLDDEQLQEISCGTPVRVHIPAAGSAVLACRVSAVVRLEQLDSVARLIAEANEREQGSGADKPAPAGSALHAGANGTSAGYAAIVPLPTAAYVNAEVHAAFTVPSKTLATRGAQWARANLRWLVP
jgi:putative peptide zinc metalloprotease protein